MAKKKIVRIGNISGIDLLKHSRPRQDIPFRTGWDKTEKDRPRKKLKPRDVEDKIEQPLAAQSPASTGSG